MSRDIKWFEHVFPYTFTPTQLQQLIPCSTDHSIQPSAVWEDSFDDDTSTDPPHVEPPSKPPHSPPTEPPSALPCVDNQSPSPDPPINPILRRLDRSRSTPAWLKDYVTPIAYSTTTPVNPQFHCFMVQLQHKSDPTTFLEAIKHPHWVQAMNEELSALEGNLTWIINDLLPESHW